MYDVASKKRVDDVSILDIHHQKPTETSHAFFVVLLTFQKLAIFQVKYQVDSPLNY